MTFISQSDIILPRYCNTVKQTIVDFMKGKYYGNFLQWFMENVNR